MLFLFSPTGPERRSAEIDKRNKEITAYHESGHAIIAYYTRDAMPINKATIMPRGPTLGHVSNMLLVVLTRNNPFVINHLVDKKCFVL